MAEDAATDGQIQIRNALEASWNKSFIPGLPNSKNCSGFLKSVAGQLGIQLPHAAKADNIIDFARKNWIKLSGVGEAVRISSSGAFVVVGMKGSDQAIKSNDGHVGVVTSGALYHGKYPPIWCGSEGSVQSQGEKSVGEVWRRSDRDRVEYFSPR